MEGFAGGDVGFVGAVGRPTGLGSAVAWPKAWVWHRTVKARRLVANRITDFILLLLFVSAVTCY
jgi:hypothetical protein